MSCLPAGDPSQATRKSPVTDIRATRPSTHSPDRPTVRRAWLTSLNGRARPHRMTASAHSTGHPYPTFIKLSAHLWPQPKRGGGPAR
jgi:hypothetical protein